jgi:NAD(P)-dependent dehydrogenase (short-subunit alcohol dehydrogenase family)
MDLKDLGGRTVLVTGSASGIGRESALAFARRGADLVPDQPMTDADRRAPRLGAAR